MQPSMIPHSSILQHAAVHTYWRANHCFAEVGELEESESAFLKERDARVICGPRCKGSIARAGRIPTDTSNRPGIVMLNVIAGYLFLGLGIRIVGQFIKNR